CSFFFQAEDGIRDFHVTGVQTCALPIYGMQSCYAFRNAKVSLFLKARDEGIGSVRLEPLELQVNFRSDSSVVQWVNTVFGQAFQIGRASCRERGKSPGVDHAGIRSKVAP